MLSERVRCVADEIDIVLDEYEKAIQVLRDENIFLVNETRELRSEMRVLQRENQMLNQKLSRYEEV